MKFFENVEKPLTSRATENKHSTALNVTPWFKLMHNFRHFRLDCPNWFSLKREFTNRTFIGKLTKGSKQPSCCSHSLAQNMSQIAVMHSFKQTSVKNKMHPSISGHLLESCIYVMIRTFFLQWGDFAMKTFVKNLRWVTSLIRFPLRRRKINYPN